MLELSLKCSNHVLQLVFIHNVYATQFDLDNCLFTYVPINCAFIVFFKMFYTCGS